MTLSKMACNSATSRRDASEQLKEPSAPEIRGRRECRVRAAPAVSCAKLCEKTHTSIQVQRKHSGIPRAMALRLMPCSPRRRIRLVTVAGGLKAFVAPGWADQNLRRLDTSNGCQDHTVLPYAKAPFVCAPFNRSRAEARPAIPFAPDAAASTASHPNVCDDPDTPLARG